MAYFVQQSTGKIVAAADGFDDDGYVPATADDIAAHNAPLEQADAKEQQSGGFLNEARTAGEEALRQVGSGTAAAVRGLSTFGGEVDAMGNPTETVEPIDVQGKDLLPRVYADDALERRETNPTAAAIGGAVPAVVAGALLPGAGAAGLASSLGIDVASAAAQEATDAELAGEGINGEHILRNAALNAVFSGVAGAIPTAARAVVRGADDVVTRAAKGAAEKLEGVGRDAITKRADAVLEKLDGALDRVKPPKVANNPNSQREAVDALLEGFEKSNPEAAPTLKKLTRAQGQQRFDGLQKLRTDVQDGSDLAAAIDSTLQREDLWGAKAVSHQADLDAARVLHPPPGSGVQAWQSYADALRKVGDEKLIKAADHLDELANMSALDGLRGSAGVQDVAGFASDTVGKRSGPLVGGLLGGWGGAAIGHVVGETVGPGVSAALKPRIVDSIVGGAKALKSYAEADQRATAHFLVDMDAAKRYARVLSDGPTAFARFQGEDRTPQQAFQRHRAALDQFAKDPSSMLSLLGEEFGNIDEQSPALYRQMVQQATKVSGYLQQEMPKPRGVSVARPNGNPPTRLEMRNWALKFGAATDPASVSADARAGRLRREQVETLKVLWPGEYQGLRQNVFEQLGKGSTPVTRQRMSLLFGFDGAIDPALGSKVRAQVAAARAKYQTAGATAKPNRNFAPQKPGSLASNMPAGEQALALGPSLG